MGGLIRQGHFLGSKLRTLRRRNGLTLEELSARCVQVEAAHAPSVSYLSMVETGKRMPSPEMLEVLAGVFGKAPGWFLDRNTDVGPPPARPGAAGSPVAGMPLEPAFLFSKDLLQSALPELLVQTGTSGPQFARLLVRVWQETHQNDFPDIEKAAERVGRRRMPLSVEDVVGIAGQLGLAIRWSDAPRPAPERRLMRARFEAPGTIIVNRQLEAQPERLKYTLAFYIGHRILHGGDGVIPQHSAMGTGGEDASAGAPATMAPQDVLMAWRDFECSAFAGALLCPRLPFRRFLAREGHSVASCAKLGVTPAVMMRRMTAVSPYRHWHFFDGYEPGYLRAVYRGNGIPLPWGNMSLVPDPCPRWAVFRLLHEARSPSAGVAATAPASQISVMRDGREPRLYCCHSMLTRDAANVPHVLSVGIDLAPALAAQGHDAPALIAAIDASCQAGGGTGALPEQAAAAIRNAAHVLNISWVREAAGRPAVIICPRSRSCPRHSPCTSPRSASG
jgi:transcriptional regulator with XRE-family HTH domain